MRQSIGSNLSIKYSKIKTNYTLLLAGLKGIVPHLSRNQLWKVLVQKVLGLQHLQRIPLFGIAPINKNNRQEKRKKRAMKRKMKRLSKAKRKKKGMMRMMKKRKKKRQLRKRELVMKKRKLKKREKVKKKSKMKKTIPP